MKKITIILFVFFSFPAFTQDVQLSHYWMDKIGQNPAMVGDGVSLNVNLLNRSQWTRLNGKFNFFNINCDSYFSLGHNSGLGVGIKTQQNQLGDGCLKSQKIETSFSYWKIFGSFLEVSVGASSSINKNSINGDLVFSDQLDGIYGFVYPSQFSFDKIESNFMFESRIGALTKIYLGADSKSRINNDKLSNYIIIGYSRSISQANNTFIGNFDYINSSTESAQAILNLRSGYGSGKSINWFLCQPYFILSKSSIQGKTYFKSSIIGSRFIQPNFQFNAGYRFARLGYAYGSENQIAKNGAIVFGVGFSNNCLSRGLNNKNKLPMDFHFSTDIALNSLSHLETGMSYEIGVSLNFMGVLKPNKSNYSNGHRRLTGCKLFDYDFKTNDSINLKDSNLNQNINILPQINNDSHDEVFAEKLFNPIENSSNSSNSIDLNKNYRVGADSVFSLFVPNALSPDFNSKNLLCNKFLPVGINLKSYQLQIYDLNGILIWETAKLENGMPSEGWNGTRNGLPLPMGVYIWKIDAEFLNGNIWEGQKSGPGITGSNGNEVPRKTGNVTLIR